jgi:hypothetical protein
MSTLQVNRIVPLSGDSVYIQGAIIQSASLALTASYVASTPSSSYSAFAVTSSYASSVGYNHTQAIADTTWTITHNLNNQHPLVQTYDVSHAMLIPQSIVGSDANTVVITFSTAITGYARIV